MNTEHKNWQVETATSGNEAYIEYFIRRDGDDVAIASDIINPETKQPSKEIADLLCAAPDLLRALQRMVFVYAGQIQNDGGYTVIDNEIRPVIAKVKGTMN